MYTASRGALCNRHLPRLPRHSRHHRPPVRRRPPTRPRQAAPFLAFFGTQSSRRDCVRESVHQAAAGAGPDTRRSTRSLGGQIIADDSWNALRPHTNRKKTRKCAQAFWPDAKELGSVRPRPARRAATPATTTPAPPPPLSARGLDNANARARRSSCQGTLWWWRWRFHPVQ